GSEARLTDQDVLVLVDARLGALRRLALRFDLELAGLLVIALRLHGNDLVARSTAGIGTGERGYGDAAADLGAVEARGSGTAGLARVVGAQLDAERTRVVAGAVLVAARIAVRAGHRPGGGEGAATAGGQHDVAITLGRSAAGQRGRGPCGRHDGEHGRTQDGRQRSQSPNSPVVHPHASLRPDISDAVGSIPRRTPRVGRA